MKILMCIGTLQIGGAEQVVVKLSNELSRRGHKLDLYVGKLGGPLQQSLSSEITVVSGAGSPSGLKNRDRILKHAQNNNYDVIFLNLGMVGLAKSLKKNANGAKIIARIGNTVGIELRETVSQRKLISALKQYLTYRFYVKPDLMVFQSQYMQDDYRKKFNPGQSEIIVKNPIRNDIALGDESIADLIAIGRLEHQKNYIGLVQAMAHTKNLSLSIIGDGPLKPQLTKQIQETGLSDRVQILSPIANPFSFFSPRSVLVSCSRYEGMSNVILEAASLGLNILATDCPSGNREISAVYPGLKIYEEKTLFSQLEELARETSACSSPHPTTSLLREHNLEKACNQLELWMETVQ